MKTWNEVLKETGINYSTLAKYRDMGLIPRPEITSRGRQGRQSLYPDEVIEAIRMIETLKERGHSLAQIREMREESGELVTTKPNPDRLTWTAKLLNELDKRYGGYTVAETELIKEETQVDGSLVVHYTAKIVPKDKK